MTYRSKYIGLIILECKLNWGLDIVDVCPPFIKCTKGEKEITLYFEETEYYKDGEDYFVNVPEPKSGSDFTILFFLNKKSNNLAMFETRDLDFSKPISLSDLPSKIKKKWEWEVTKQTSTILK